MFVPPPRNFGATFGSNNNSLWIFSSSANNLSLQHDDPVLCALGKLYPTSFEEFLAIREASLRREAVLNQRKVWAMNLVLSRDGGLEDDDLSNELSTGHIIGWEKNFETYGLAADVTDVSNEMVSVSVLDEAVTAGGGGGGFDEQLRKRQEEKLEAEEMEDCVEISHVAFAIREKGQLRMEAIQSISINKSIENIDPGDNIEGNGEEQRNGETRSWPSPIITKVQLHPLLGGVLSINDQHIGVSSSSASLGSARDLQVWEAVNEAFKIKRETNNDQNNTDDDNNDNAAAAAKVLLDWKHSPLGASFRNQVSKYFKVQGSTSSELHLRIEIRNVDKEEEEERKLLYALGSHLSKQLRRAECDFLACDIEKRVSMMTTAKSLLIHPPRPRNDITTSDNEQTSLICFLCELPIRGVSAACRKGCGRVWHLRHGTMSGEGGGGIDCVECRVDEENHHSYE